MIDALYRYRAALNRVIDGDTYDLMIDLGFRASLRVAVRLNGYNAPELPTPDGVLAREAAAALLFRGPIVVQTYKDQRSFERWVADVYVAGQHLGPLLVAQGLARAVKA
jgi:micrococcal nuclease